MACSWTATSCLTLRRTILVGEIGQLARSPKWKQSYQIKLNLVQNPRTPSHISQKLIPYLFEHDVKALSKSKNVTGQVVTAAKQHLARKNKK